MRLAPPKGKDMNVVSVNPALTATVEQYKIEQFKTEIVSLLDKRPDVRSEFSQLDSIGISDFGRLLFELSKVGSDGAHALVEQVMNGVQNGNLYNFMQAYCVLFGYPFPSDMVSYDRFGNPDYTGCYRALREYLRRYASDDESADDEDDPIDALLKKLKALFQKISRKKGAQNEERS